MGSGHDFFNGRVSWWNVDARLGSNVDHRLWTFCGGKMDHGNRCSLLQAPGFDKAIVCLWFPLARIERQSVHVRPTAAQTEVDAMVRSVREIRDRNSPHALERQLGEFGASTCCWLG